MVELRHGLTAHRSERTAEEYIAVENDVHVCLSHLDPWDPARLQEKRFFAIILNHLQQNKLV